MANETSTEESLTAAIAARWPNGFPVRIGDITGSALRVKDGIVHVWLSTQDNATFPLADVEPLYRRVVATITVPHRVGGEHLVSMNTVTGEVLILTGPTPWGTGSWGPFEASTVSGVRDPLPLDSWPVSGCPSERWTVADLDYAIRRARWPR